MNRRAFTHQIIETSKGIYFGGGILHNLQVLDIGCFDFPQSYSEEEISRLKQSLKDVAPNLKYMWGECSFLFENHNEQNNAASSESNNDV